MSIPILIDMNLSPAWVDALTQEGWPSCHWSTIGDCSAPDCDIMEWARANGHVVFTHDLDFGTMLALTQAEGPSVMQVRGLDVLPDHLLPVVLLALNQFESDLASGALLVVDEARARVRLLPIGERQEDG